MKQLTFCLISIIVLFVNIYSEKQIPNSMGDFYSECLLFKNWHNMMYVTDKNGYTDDFCNNINECNEIFIGTIIHDTSYSIHKDSTKDSITIHNYKQFRIHIDSIILGQSKAGSNIELAFNDGSNRQNKCKFINEKGDSTEGMEVFLISSSRHYDFKYGQRAIFIANKDNNVFKPIAGIKLDCKYMVNFKECLEKIQNRKP
jgi:hypothetical protein